VLTSPVLEKEETKVNDISKVNDIKEYRYFAGGEWRAAENHKLFDVFRPYDRGLYARVAAGGRPEAKLAVDAAAKAFPAWSQTRSEPPNHE
jgi:Aldehyde dehydrogenase family